MMKTAVAAVATLATIAASEGALSVGYYKASATGDWLSKAECATGLSYTEFIVSLKPRDQYVVLSSSDPAIVTSCATAWGDILKKTEEPDLAKCFVENEAEGVLLLKWGAAPLCAIESGSNCNAATQYCALPQRNKAVACPIETGQTTAVCPTSDASASAVAVALLATAAAIGTLLF